MSELFSRRSLTALFQVIMIDLVLAGDNAIVIGLAAAGLPKEQRGKAILIGIIAATVLRIVFALVTTQLLAIVGLLLAGGILLLWVCWKMWRELRTPPRKTMPPRRRCRPDVDASGDSAGGAAQDLRQAALQIIIADVSMSLDNVLAVAGAAREHPGADLRPGAVDRADGHRRHLHRRLLQKHRWIAYVGLAIILYVAVDMIYRGANEVWPHLQGAM